MCVLQIRVQGKFKEVVISQGWSSGKTQQKCMDLGISTTYLLTEEGESPVSYMWQFFVFEKGTSYIHTLSLSLSLYIYIYIPEERD